MDLTQLEGYELLGRFRLGKLLGQGGYGAVFEAVQLSVGRRCAVKILQAQQIGAADNVVGRFRAEAVVTSRLAHPNTVVIYDFGHDQERDLLFLAMEFLEGRSLHEVLSEEGSLQLDVALHIVDQIASSLQDAHEQGVVHRDLKPHNVMILRRGADDYFVKVIDFGIAKVLAGDIPTSAEKQLTMTGVMVGTPHYMAPEQIRGQRVDGRADIYALGHCIYKLLIGRTCFQGGAPMDIAIRQLSDRPLPLRALDASLDVSSSFERVVLRALEKEREARWPSMIEFTQALREAARAHRRPAPEPALEPMRAEERTGKMATIPPTEPLPAPTLAPSSDDVPTPLLLPKPPDEPSLGPTHPLPTPPEPATRPSAAPPPEPSSASPAASPEPPASPRDGGTLAMPTPVEPAQLPARLRHPTPTDAISTASAIPLRERDEADSTSAQHSPAPQAPVRAPLLAALVVGLLFCAAVIAVAAAKLGGDEPPQPGAEPTPQLAAAPTAPATTLSAPPAPDMARVDQAPDAGLIAAPDMQQAATPAPDMAAAPPEPEPKPKIKPEVKEQPPAEPKRRAAAKSAVELQVVIVPYGELYMDGKRIAKGTRMTVSVPPGKHTFEARDGAMRSDKVAQEITPDSNETLRLSLRKAPAP